MIKHKLHPYERINYDDSWKVAIPFIVAALVLSLIVSNNCGGAP